MELVFTEKSSKDLRKLDRNVATRVVEKLKFCAAQKDPLSFAEPIRDNRFGDYRFRIGDWRALADVGDDKIVVHKIGHRSIIYQ